MNLRTPSAILLVLASLAGTSVSATAATQQSVHFTYLPPSVSPNQIVSIQAIISPKTEECSTVLLGPATTTILPSHRTKTGEVHWEYKMPVSSKGGKWSAVISCNSDNHAIRHFRVVTQTSTDLISSCQSDGYSVLTAVAAFHSENHGVIVTTKGLTGKSLGGPFITHLPRSGDYYSFSIANGEAMISTNLSDPTPFTSTDQCFILP